MENQAEIARELHELLLSKELPDYHDHPDWKGIDDFFWDDRDEHSLIAQISEFCSVTLSADKVRRLWCWYSWDRKALWLSVPSDASFYATGLIRVLQGELKY